MRDGKKMRKRSTNLIVESQRELYLNQFAIVAVERKNEFE